MRTKPENQERNRRKKKMKRVEAGNERREVAGNRAGEGGKKTMGAWSELKKA